MRRVILFVVMLFFLVTGMSWAGTPEGVDTKSVSSAKIENVEFKPDKKGIYYVNVTIRNVSGEDKPFYILLQAEEEVSMLYASGKKGNAKPVPSGKTFTFKVNTYLKTKPEKVSMEIVESLPRSGL